MKDKEVLLEHTININDYVAVKLMIPSTLDASELQGLMTLSKKLVNLHVVQPMKKMTTTKKGYNPWTEAEKALFDKLWDNRKSVANNIAYLEEKLPNRRKSQINARYYYLEKQNASA